ncbi:hypothetical protein D3C87_40260 [compost metagenome]
MNLEKIFNYSMRAFFSPDNSTYNMPAIGIAFANSEFPSKAIEMIPDNGVYTLDIEITPILLNITCKDSLTQNTIFSTKLNYDSIELDEFRKKIINGSVGLFVIGTFVECHFYVIGTKKSKPYQVKQINFID